MPDEMIKDTFVVKMHTDTLICHVIYQSKFEIINLSMVEAKEDIVDEDSGSRSITPGQSPASSESVKGPKNEENDNAKAVKLNDKMEVMPSAEDESVEQALIKPDMDNGKNWKNSKV